MIPVDSGAALCKTHIIRVDRGLPGFKGSVFHTFLIFSRGRAKTTEHI